MSSLVPRIVLVIRQTEYAALLAGHGTRGQAAFLLAERGVDIDAVEARDHQQTASLATAKRAIPSDWSLAQVVRDDLSRFLFFPNDIIVAVGQDGLVANVAKYLSHQSVIGVSPDPAVTEGALTPFTVDALKTLLPAKANNEATHQARAIV